MKRLFLLFFTICMLLSFSACGKVEPKTEDSNLNVVTTVFPAYDFAREIAGDKANVSPLIPPGSEIHSFEPTAKDIMRIQSCDLLICNGGESEAWLTEILDGMDSTVPTLVMIDCVDALEEEIKEGMQGEEHEEASEKEYDEHVWTSPVNAQIICQAICEKFVEADGENEAFYRDCLESYVNQLQDLDKAFRQVVAEGSHKTVIFADRFPVRYFVEEYGLNYYAAFPGCADDAEPSAKTVAFLIDEVRKESIPGVFYIEFSNQKMADIICEDTGCKKLLFHSCHNVSADELKQGVSYLSLMENNVEALREALG